MDDQKKSIDIRVILNQLNIPEAKFKEWKSLEQVKRHSLPGDAWMTESSVVFSMEKGTFLSK
ncbi:hypothetical protein [Paenibacillus piri]|uniref:Uncharacterized protein n=1 Tax=Paenibacillus piri TaxID=2547395 RepID=A0A4R5KYK3_9BACL|nr:hypothetical protein [Paenibacillus piri]TDG00329.1 hypothetical protein E1757_01410 [Paenibacillus piri]